MSVEFPSVPLSGEPASVFAGGAGQAGERHGIGAKAARIHALGRLRARHFSSKLLADSAMEILLSLFVGELQGIILSETTLALANGLSREEVNAIIDQMVHAGLAVITGIEPDRRTVGLTPIGSARTRSYVDDHPNV